MVAQQEEHALITIRLLAKGIVEMGRLVAEGAIVRQDEMPAPLRSGLERLSRHCLLDGAEDFGANVHVLMALACKPIGEWEVRSFAEPFSHARAISIDSNLGVPTDDCIEIGNISSEMDAYEDIHHRRLREAVRSQGKRANEVYAGAGTYHQTSSRKSKRAVKIHSGQWFDQNCGRLSFVASCDSDVCHSS